jgi:3-oxoacyl-[acyl-carrier-protein] synthase II
MSANDRRRVVVTGMGAVTPNGLTMADTWASIRAGRSGVSRIEGFSMPEGSVNIAGQVKGFEPTDYLDKRTVRKTDRFAQLSVAAATQAVADADLDIAADAARIGCSIGTGIGGLKTQEIAHAKLFEAGPDRLSPFWVTALIANMGAAEVSMALGTRGPLTT